MTKLVLLDGHSLAYRAFYALPPDIATPSGQVTNAVFGFTSMLIKLLGDESPDALAVAWDRREPTFRKEKYPEYKANRESAPDLFRSQVPIIREVLEVLEIPQVSAPGYEADDVIATLVEDGRELGYEVLVVTGDRDAFQLSTDDVTVLYTKRGISDTVHATPDWIRERYGVGPQRYVEYAALRGDTSDNLPGVPGVGEKTASKLLGSYVSLEELYENLDDLTPKLRESLEDSRYQVFTNRELMTMVRDVPIEELSPEDLILEPFDRDAVHALFSELDFRNLWTRLTDLGGVTDVEGEIENVEVLTATIKEQVKSLTVDGTIALEPVWGDEELLGLMVAGDVVTYVQMELVPCLLDAVAESGGLIIHNSKPLLRALLESGLRVPHVAFDTMLAAWVVNPAKRAPTLEELAYRELGVEVGSDQVRGTPQSQGAFSFEEDAVDLGYFARRALVVGRLVEGLTEQMVARGGDELFLSVELPLTPILARMEQIGVRLDTGLLREVGIDLTERVERLIEEIQQLAGHSFNVNSPQQLGVVLFEELGLPVLKKTPKGAPSTGASVLEKLSDEHEIVVKILSFRELDTLRSTYVDALLKLVDDDGRVRGRFNQTGASTGRLSMARPNLQTIPARSREGLAIRETFVAKEGSTLLVADYSQIELRILAHLSEDAGLVEAFANDVDIHAATAARINDVPLSEVTEEMRRRSKMINFGLLYGMESYGLAQRLDIDRGEAQRYIDEYFMQFPDVKAYMAGIVEEARECGFTTTILGRRRYLPELNSMNVRDMQMGERMALNAPIQGSAADIIKKAMIDLHRKLTDGGYESEIILQIHDELVLEVPVGEVEDVTTLTVETMEGVASLNVPLRVAFGTGATLVDASH